MQWHSANIFISLIFFYTMFCPCLHNALIIVMSDWWQIKKICASNSEMQESRCINNLRNTMKICMKICQAIVMLRFVPAWQPGQKTVLRRLANVQGLWCLVLMAVGAFLYLCPFVYSALHVFYFSDVPFCWEWVRTPALSPTQRKVNRVRWKDISKVVKHRCKCPWIVQRLLNKCSSSYALLRKVSTALELRHQNCITAPWLGVYASPISSCSLPSVDSGCRLASDGTLPWPSLDEPTCLCSCVIASVGAISQQKSALRCSCTIAPE